LYLILVAHLLVQWYVNSTIKKYTFKYIIFSPVDVLCVDVIWSYVWIWWL